MSLLCSLQESGYCFWPSEIGDSNEYGKLTIKLLSVTTHGDIVIRRLVLLEGATQLNKSHMVTLLQLTSWPMRDLPNSTAVLSLIDELTHAQMKSSAKRTIVMCRCKTQPQLIILLGHHAYNSVFLTIFSQWWYESDRNLPHHPLPGGTTQDRGCGWLPPGHQVSSSPKSRLCPQYSKYEYIMHKSIINYLYPHSGSLYFLQWSAEHIPRKFRYVLQFSIQKIDLTHWHNDFLTHRLVVCLLQYFAECIACCSCWH